ncbi:hypothetical protein [Leptospira brenneri]|uniref:hypothetical protein n=1 Tax=Leptospira brenneri TaxID=2023182 RepID=UPI000C2AC56D|nr:hypothetical protein [Leptospira brenneri]PJZ43641.1 hypothetical protein CH361_19410 [Leptospira brenneri]
MALEKVEYIPKYAICQTGSHELVYQNEKFITEIINLQLQYWRDAVYLFRNIEKKEKVSIQSIIPIFLLLGQSLVTLFGLNIQEQQNSKVPPLFQLVSNFKDSNGKKLSQVNRRLYENFKKLDYFYTKLIKHPTPKKMHELISLSFEDLLLSLRTTQEIWIWFMNEIGIGKENYEKYFSEKF